MVNSINLEDDLQSVPSQVEDAEGKESPIQDCSIDSTTKDACANLDDESSSDTSSSSSVDQDELESAVEEFEAKLSSSEMNQQYKNGVSNDLNQGKGNQASGNSVEYWSVGRKGKPKNLLKKFPARKSGNYCYGGRGQKRNWTGKRWENSEVQEVEPSMYFSQGAKAPPPCVEPSNGISFPTGPYFQAHSLQPLEQSSSVQFFAAPAIHPVGPMQQTFFTQSQPPSIQIFIPPPQTPPEVSSVQASHPTFVPYQPVTQFIPMPPTPPAYAVAPLPTHYQPCVQYFPQPHPIPISMHLAGPTQAVSYYHGPPMFYSANPPTPQMNPVPLSQISPGYMVPFNSNFQEHGGYSGPVDYPPPTYEDAVLLPPPTPLFVPHLPHLEATVPIQQPPQESMECADTAIDSTSQENVVTDEASNQEAEEGNNDSSEPTVQNNTWVYGNYFGTPASSPTATASSSETNVTETGQSMEYPEMSDVPVSSSPSYSSLSSGPLSIATSSAESSPASSADLSNISMSSSETNVEPEYTHTNTEYSSDESYSVTIPSGYSENTSFSISESFDQFALDLRALNDARMNSFVHDATPFTHSNPQIIVYPGEAAILIYSRMDGFFNAISYKEKELPYVANIFDFRIQTSFREQSGPIQTYSYYVPPRTADDDYFGGQLATWQLKLLQYFIKYQPHNWKMYGVPESFNLQAFLATSMRIVDEFHIVSKLRFCCRRCKTPWTSKKGTIVFKFCYNPPLQQGWILMRIFGQICMKQDCPDWTFQSPACYPEEIDRAMKKLSEYVGNKCYGMTVKADNFAECHKSIRKSGIGGSDAKESSKTNNAAPHRREFCQACMSGVCKNLYVISSHPNAMTAVAHSTGKEETAQ